MATRSDAAELAVDDLRRRARRRLVGAILLALTAAVLLPLLLESEPKPLGDDVSIQIPPVDSGKFINPLSSAKAPDPKVKGGAAGARSSAPLPNASPPSEAPAVPSAAPQEGPRDSGTRPAITPPAAAPALASPPPTAAPTGTVDTKAAVADSNPDAAGAATAQSGTDPAAEAKAAPAAPARAEAANSGAAYVVQIAAFSDRFGARSLASKLKRGGFPGYTEAVTTDKGTLHRVRVGPYTSREAADAALVKLKAAGFNGMVAHVG